MAGRRRQLVGNVIPSKMDKTVVVQVSRKFPHPVYQKRVKRYKNYLAHVASLEPNDGDIVKISSTKPISKLKRWQVSKIVRKAVRLG